MDLSTSEEDKMNVLKNLYQKQCKFQLTPENILFTTTNNQSCLTNPEDQILPAQIEFHQNQLQAIIQDQEQHQNPQNQINLENQEPYEQQQSLINSIQNEQPQEIESPNIAGHSRSKSQVGYKLQDVLLENVKKENDKQNLRRFHIKQQKSISRINFQDQVQNKLQAIVGFFKKTVSNNEKQLRQGLNQKDLVRNDFERAQNNQLAPQQIVKLESTNLQLAKARSTNRETFISQNEEESLKLSQPQPKVQLVTPSISLKKLPEQIFEQSFTCPLQEEQNERLRNPLQENAEISIAIKELGMKKQASRFVDMDSDSD